MNRTLRQLRYLFTLVVCLLCLQACNDTEVVSAKGEKLWLTANINGIDGTSRRFEGGDGIGMWIGSGKGTVSIDQANLVDNIRYMQSAGGLVSEPRTLVDNSSDITIYAYYPYSPNATGHKHDYSFCVSERQDTFSLKDPREYQKVDLLWASRTIAPSDRQMSTSVPIEFGHAMGRVVVHARAKSGTKGAISDARVSLVNVASEAVVDMQTGIATPSANSKTNVMGITYDTPASGYEVSGAIISVPQTIKKGEVALSITTRGNVDITWVADRDITIEGGKQLTLLVEVDQNECEVTVGEITTWATDENVIGGIAMEDLPVYHMWDVYNRNGICGVVVSVDETGKHGWVCSTDYTTLPYSTFEFGLYWPQAYSDTDGYANVEELRKVDPTLEHYPAAKWCDDKNQGDVTGWVLPPSAVLQSFGRKIMGYDCDANIEAFNNAVMSAPVPASEKMKLPEMNWNDIQGQQYYLTSTLSMLDRVRTAACQVGEAVFNGNNGYVNNITLQQTEYGFVRAFYKF